MAGTTAYEEMHLRSLKELEDSPQVRVFHSERGPIEESVGDAGTTFAKIASWTGVQLDPGLQKCFLRFEGISSHWQLDRNGVKISGEFSLCHLAAAMLTVGVEGETEYATPEECQIYSELRLFDDQPRGGVETFSGQRNSPGKTSPENWYHDGPLGFFKMDLDYCTYLNALLATKGTYGWQHLFTTVGERGVDPEVRVESLGNMLEIFPTLFPDRDYLDLRDRLEARL
jgi:hypothetical protein